MRSAMLVALLAASAAALPSTAAAGTAPGAYAPGQVIVKFRPGVRASQRSAALRERGAAVDRALPLPRTFVAHVPSGAGVEGAARALARDPHVAWAEPNARQTAGSVADDAFFGEQWSLRNTGQTVDGVAGAAGA